ncbi:CPBP family intramembrane metalloprotease [Massilia oculi]|uniref:CPBP family intramembrane metalloprotease n=1 Tax=Massilia hydrophila TaxID=3044279 RepID=A0ABS7Y835_9BURK|nr:type II CAAX endopeptidase family protein [Massilia oculi]MCA1854704.1 CPBP family intramembrane metalloprotease [Massilia oculi]
MRLREFADRHPVLAATGCAALQFGLTILILKAGKLLAPPEAWGKVKLLAFASTVLLPLLLTQVFGMWREVGFGSIRPNGFFLACLLPVLMFAALGLHLPQGGIGGDLLIQSLNAFGEELLFRGVIFVILLRLPVWQAIVLNGVLFGSMHLIHGYMDGNWSHALGWAMMSSCAGMMFAAARERTGSLWLVVVLHMVLNLASMYSNIEAVAGPQMLVAVQYATKVAEVVLGLYVIVTAWRHRPAGAGRA